VISQGIYVYFNKKIVEGNIFKKINKGFKDAGNKIKKGFKDVGNKINKGLRVIDIRNAQRMAREAARRKYLKLLGKFVNKSNSRYLNVIGQFHVDNLGNHTILQIYNQVQSVDALVKQSKIVNNDKEFEKIIKQTVTFLNSKNSNSAKMYYLSNYILKVFQPFYKYDIKNDMSQFNFLRIMYSKKIKDDAKISKKYSNFISFLAVSQVANRITSVVLDPSEREFRLLSDPVIDESKRIIRELNFS
jgi:hypothetical protein